MYHWCRTVEVASYMLGSLVRSIYGGLFCLIRKNSLFHLLLVSDCFHFHFITKKKMIFSKFRRKKHLSLTIPGSSIHKRTPKCIWKTYTTNQNGWWHKIYCSCSFLIKPPLLGTQQLLVDPPDAWWDSQLLDFSSPGTNGWQ